MKRNYYYTHCGALHPLHPEEIEVVNGELIRRPAVVVCPICWGFFHLHRVRYLDIEE